jgi:hypothetical protein
LFVYGILDRTSHIQTSSHDLAMLESRDSPINDVEAETLRQRPHDRKSVVSYFLAVNVVLSQVLYSRRVSCQLLCHAIDRGNTILVFSCLSTVSEPEACVKRLTL